VVFNNAGYGLAGRSKGLPTTKSSAWSRPYVHSTEGLDDLLQALQLGLQIEILNQPVQVFGMDS